MLAAPLLPLADPADVDLAHSFAPPSAGHPLGTDSNGRDLLARLVWGSRTALLGPLVVTAVATTVGVLLAVAAAWRGGWLDGVTSRVFDIGFAFPGVLLALVVAAVVGAGLGAAVVALAVAFVPSIGRVTRGPALQQLRLPYVDALRVQGHSPVAICARHLLPNLGALVIAQATVTFGYALVDLAALWYLGLGVDQATPDWGVMVAAGRPDILAGHPQQSLYAGALIVVAVAACSVIRERISDREPGGAPGGALLEIEGLRVSVPDHGALRVVVDRVDLSITAGESVGLVGESGSGKTITAKAVLGLLPPGARAEGSVRFDGREVLRMSPSKLPRLTATAGRRSSSRTRGATPTRYRPVGDFLTEGCAATRACPSASARTGPAELLRAVGVEDPKGPHGQLSPRAVRWSPPAGHDRRGALGRAPAPPWPTSRPRPWTPSPRRR